MANPFYVDPGNNFAPALSGLSSALGDFSQAKKQKAQQEKMEQRFAEVQSAMQEAYESGDPNKIAEVSIRYPEAQKTMEMLYGFKSDATKQNAKETYRSVLAGRDNPQAALDAINSRIQFVESQGGDPSTITLQARDRLQKMIETGQNTDPFFRAAELEYAGLATPQEWKAYVGDKSDGLTPYQRQSLELQKQRLDRTAVGTSTQRDWETYQDLKKTNPAEAQRFGRAAGFETQEGQKLSAYAEKQLSEASDEFNKSSAAANKYKGLSDSIRDAGMSGGIKSTMSEFIKEQTGGQDDITALRKEALAIVNSEAINNLPPGPATDRDIQLARAPFPTEKASPEYLANWLEAISRLSQKRAEYAEFKADFIANKGTFRDQKGNSLANAWKQAQMEQQSSEAEIDDLVNKYAD